MTWARRRDAASDLWDFLSHDYFLINRDGSLTPLPPESVTVIRLPRQDTEGDIVGYLVEGHKHPAPPEVVINWEHS